MPRLKIAAANPGVIHDAHGDLSFECNADIHTAIPEGTYEVSFVRAEKKFLWKREKAFLHFVVQTLGGCNGVKLFMACNIPPKGRWAMSSKYWRMWCLANGQRPLRADRMSTTIFRNKIFLARVRTVRTSHNQIDLTPETQYSVIDELLEVAAGR